MITYQYKEIIDKLTKEYEGYQSLANDAFNSWINTGSQDDKDRETAYTGRAAGILRALIIINGES